LECGEPVDGFTSVQSLIGLAGPLFASWYCTGFVGCLDGMICMMWVRMGLRGTGLEEEPGAYSTTLSVLTVVSTAFFCVAGTYVTIKGIITQYNERSKVIIQFRPRHWEIDGWQKFQNLLAAEKLDEVSRSILSCVAGSPQDYLGGLMRAAGKAIKYCFGGQETSSSTLHECILVRILDIWCVMMYSDS